MRMKYIGLLAASPKLSKVEITIEPKLIFPNCILIIKSFYLIKSVKNNFH